MTNILYKGSVPKKGTVLKNFKRTLHKCSTLQVNDYIYFMNIYLCWYFIWCKYILDLLALIVVHSRSCLVVDLLFKPAVSRSTAM